MGAYVVKLSPQPQLPFEFGFLNTNSDLQGNSARVSDGRPACRSPILPPPTDDAAIDSQGSNRPSKPPTMEEISHDAVQRVTMFLTKPCNPCLHFCKIHLFDWRLT